MKRRLIIAVFILYVLCLVLYLASSEVNFGFPMYQHYIHHHVSDTTSENIVNSIYMFYRFFDTIFESLVFLFAIIAIIYLSIHESGDTYE